MRTFHVGIGTVCLLLLVSPALANVYFNDFDGNEAFNSGVTGALGGAGELTDVQDYDGIGTGANVFGGDFLRNDTPGLTPGEAPGTPTVLTLNNLPPHDGIEINFLLAILDTWDGSRGSPFGGSSAPDYFNVVVDGQTIFKQTFDNGLRSQLEPSHPQYPNYEDGITGCCPYEEKGYEFPNGGAGEYDGSYWAELYSEWFEDYEYQFDAYPKPVDLTPGQAWDVKTVFPVGCGFFTEPCETRVEWENPNLWEPLDGTNQLRVDSGWDMGLEPVFDHIPHIASSVTIEFFADGALGTNGWGGGTSESWAIDNIEVIAIIPEPSSILLCLGGVGMALLRRRPVNRRAIRP